MSLPSSTKNHQYDCHGHSVMGCQGGNTPQPNPSNCSTNTVAVQGGSLRVLPTHHPPNPALAARVPSLVSARPTQPLVPLVPVYQLPLPLVAHFSVVDEPPVFKGKPRRSGKWTREEEVYADLLIEMFEKGIANEKNGASLRVFLSRYLHCAPMRISKKYAGKGIGKMLYTYRMGTLPFNLALQSCVSAYAARLHEAESKFYIVALQTQALFDPQSAAVTAALQSSMDAHAKPTPCFSRQDVVAPAETPSMTSNQPIKQIPLASAATPKLPGMTSTPYKNAAVLPAVMQEGPGVGRLNHPLPVKHTRGRSLRTIVSAPREANNHEVTGSSDANEEDDDTVSDGDDYDDDNSSSDGSESYDCLLSNQSAADCLRRSYLTVLQQMKSEEDKPVSANATPGPHGHVTDVRNKAHDGELPDFLSGFEDIVGSKGGVVKKVPSPAGKPFTTKSFDDFHRLLGTGLSPPESQLNGAKSHIKARALPLAPSIPEDTPDNSSSECRRVPLPQRSTHQVILPKSNGYGTENYCIFAQQSAEAVRLHSAYNASVVSVAPVAGGTTHSTELVYELPTTATELAQMRKTLVSDPSTDVISVTSGNETGSTSTRGFSDVASSQSGASESGSSRGKKQRLR